ncbi:MAG: hypothetical protein J5I81_05460 [Nitrococcus mobilis]|nr:hypothetical protein [Nitrococcus mobilis]
MSTSSHPGAVVNIRQLSSLLGVTQSAVSRRAKREGWPFKEEAVRGGWRRLYPVKELPPHVRLALAGERVKPQGHTGRPTRTNRHMVARSDLRLVAMELRDLAEHHELIARELAYLAEALLPSGKEDADA